MRIDVFSSEIQTHNHLSGPFQAYGGNRLFVTRSRGKEEFQYEPVNQFAMELDHFAQCVMNDIAPLTPGEEGLKDMKIMMAAYESAAAGKSIKVV